jgi:GT2 family glycosyltransferase
MTSVAIIVLNWNGIDDTEKCIDSLLNQSYSDYSIIVIDNGSKDTSLEKLKKIEAEGKIILIAQPKNTGFAGGVNIGIKHALENNFDAVALFNNDAVADERWLEELVKHLNKASAVTSLLLSEDGKKIDSTEESYTIWGMPFPKNRGELSTHAPDSRFIFGATGGATLYKTSLFKEIGIFDESFFAYYEDVDVSFRAQLAGHKIYYAKDAIAYHRQGATSKKIPGFTVYQTFKNIPLLYTKDVPTGLLVLVGIRLFLLYWLIFGNAIKNGSGKYALKGWLASIWFFWTKSLWDRFYIQSHKTVPTSYIKSLLWYDLPPEQTGLRKLRKKFSGK